MSTVGLVLHVASIARLCTSCVNKYVINIFFNAALWFWNGGKRVEICIILHNREEGRRIVYSGWSAD